MAGLLDKAKEYLSEKVAEMEKPEATVTDVDLKDDQFEKDMESAKDCYMVLSEETREPFDTETFTNVDGGKWIWTALTNADSVDNEYTVVTIMILARGNYSIPSSRVDAAFSRVDAALQTFLSIPARKIKTVEVLWSPQREDETISKGQLRKYFPHMKFERIS